MLTGLAMEQLQEMFGPLVESQLSMMDWAPCKREAEQDSAPSDRSKAQRRSRAREELDRRESNKPHWRRAGWPPTDQHDQSPGETSTPAGDSAQDTETGLQMGAVCTTWESGASPIALRGRAKMEEDPGEGTHHDGAADNAVRMPDPDASHWAEGHWGRGIDPIPEEGGGHEVAEGRPLVLPEVVPGSTRQSRRYRTPSCWKPWWARYRSSRSPT